MMMMMMMIHDPCHHAAAAAAAITSAMKNSHRLDLTYSGDADRMGQRTSIKRVLPANERGQGR
jgi:hypothetical protein